MKKLLKKDIEKILKNGKVKKEWTADEDLELIKYYNQGLTAGQITMSRVFFDRHPYPQAVGSRLGRLRKMGVIE
jgi:hypothetical protein